MSLHFIINRNIYKYVGIRIIMVEIKEVKKGKKKYYYLVHSYREGKKVLKKQSYLGDSIPKDIEERERLFMREFYRQRFLEDIDKIRSNFNSEYKAMPQSAKEKSKENFAIKFTYNTQRIEGSTLTLKETASLLEDGITPSAKPLRDVKEAEAHKKVFYDMLNEKDLTIDIVLKWHRELFEGTKKDIAGKIREHEVGIARSKFKPPKHQILKLLLKEFFDWYNENKKKIHPMELSSLVHLKFVTIHPFSDGNGRISRLMMNFVLKKFDFPLLDIPYNKRNSYYNALEKSQVNKEENTFVQWLFRKYLEEYKEKLD
jgi:Fic family protein